VASTTNLPFIRAVTPQKVAQHIALTAAFSGCTALLLRDIWDTESEQEFSQNLCT
jgi:hypothetical protein